MRYVVLTCVLVVALTGPAYADLQLHAGYAYSITHDYSFNLAKASFELYRGVNLDLLVIEDSEAGLGISYTIHKSAVDVGVGYIPHDAGLCVVVSYRL